MVIAAADPRGNYGLELWLQKTWLRSRNAVHLVRAEPRRLLAVASTTCGDLAFLVCHTALVADVVL